MADVAPVLDDNSFIQVVPVTLDADNNPVSYGMPVLVKLSDLKTYFTATEPTP